MDYYYSFNDKRVKKNKDNFVVVERAFMERLKKIGTLDEIEEAFDKYFEFLSGIDRVNFSGFKSLMSKAIYLKRKTKQVLKKIRKGKKVSILIEIDERKQKENRNDNWNS
jgi:hypothetical protein